MASRGRLHPFDPGGAITTAETTTDDLGPLTPGQEQLLVRLQGSMEAYFPEFSTQGAREVVVDAFRQADLTFGTQAAKAWAADWEFPQDLVDRDIERLRSAGGSLVELARRVRSERRATRLNPDRVVAVLSPDNPEYAAVMEFATTGVPLLLADDFRPSGVDGRPRLRPIVLETGMATTKKMMESYVRDDLAIALPLPVVQSEVVEVVHLSADSWATKQATEEGRTVVDCNDGGTGSSLNCDQVYEEAVLRWKKINNPTLNDIMCMILRFFDTAKSRNPAIRWTDLRIWKMDLKGAFTLLNFALEGVPFLGTEVNMLVFYLVGLYGWTAILMVFQVINRAVVWQLSRPSVLKGLMDMYTDDLFGVCLKEDLAHDMDKVASFCRSFLGPKAIADKKTESGLRLTLIGWDVDLIQVLVTIARRNTLKAWYGYSRVELSAQVLVPLVQAWASWAERYEEICLWMRPFRRVMYQMIKGKEKQRYVSVTAMGHRVVRLYQALLTLVATQEGWFTRSFDSFRTQYATLRITFDGSLHGTGLVWHCLRRRGTKTLLGCAGFSLRALMLSGKPEYQNVCEFFSILLGLIVALLMGWDTSAVEIIGDSATALTWTETGRFRSDNVINAVTVCAALCATHVVNIVGQQHILEKFNKVADTMSRRRVGESWTELIHRTQRRTSDQYDQIGVTPGQIPVEIQLRCLDEVLHLCDPRREFTDEKEFAGYWRGVRSFVRNLSSLNDL